MDWTSIFEILKKKAVDILAETKNNFMQMLNSITGRAMPSADTASITSQASTDETENLPREERHKVAGVSFHTDAIQGLGVENPDYNLTKKQLIDEGMTDERIYQTEFGVYTCNLVPEPDNPVAPKAIKVVTYGAHIGYIKKGSCAHIHKLLQEDRIDHAVCEFGGGSYKIVLTDYNENGKEIYSLERETIPYSVTLVITLKD